MKKIKQFFSNVRYQKFVTTFLYLAIFTVMVYTFWEFNFVGESVSADIYNKTMDTLLGLLCTTTGLKLGEVAGETFENVERIRHNLMKKDEPYHSDDIDDTNVDDMRGGE